MEEKLDKDSLIVVNGEMRDGPATSLSANALMTRPHLKRLNKQAQRALFGKAEPFSVFAGMLGMPYEGEFLDKALEYMLLAHPHDSINGVAQDKTESDTIYRLDQTIEIASAVYHKSCGFILSNLDDSQYVPGEVLLAVFNPLPCERDETCRAFIDTPTSESIWSFGLEDMDGQKTEVRHIGRQVKTVPVSDRNARPWPNRVDRHEIIFKTGTLPAGGYKNIPHDQSG